MSSGVRAITVWPGKPLETASGSYSWGSLEPGVVLVLSSVLVTVIASEAPTPETVSSM